MPFPQTIAASETMRTGSTLYLCALWQITRRDGVKIRLTAHDRDLTFRGKLYSAGVLSTIGDIRRRAGNESSATDCNSLIDGSLITLPAIKANKYQDAMVDQFIVDWRQPWILFRQDRWWITMAVDDGEGVAMCRLESRASRMQQNAGSKPWGGVYVPKCGANLGDAFCTKDISGDTYTGVTVTAVSGTRPRYVFTMDPGTWPAGSRYDDYYRGGEIQWTSGANDGEVCEILYYTHSTRDVELLLPAPLRIEVGDTATVRPGCDGLLATCRDKFGNLPNWRGVLDLNDARDLLSPDAEGNDP